MGKNKRKSKTKWAKYLSNVSLTSVSQSLCHIRGNVKMTQRGLTLGVQNEKV